LPKSGPTSCDPRTLLAIPHSWSLSFSLLWTLHFIVINSRDTVLSKSERNWKGQKSYGTRDYLFEIRRQHGLGELHFKHGNRRLDVYGFKDPKRIESHIPSQIFLYPQLKILPLSMHLDWWIHHALPGIISLKSRDSMHQKSYILNKVIIGRIANCLTEMFRFLSNFY
jgi:hypothetical protein